MKKLFNNRPWKKWKTRKASFIGVLLFLMLYTGVSFLLSWFDHSIDETVTVEVFKTGRWVIITGTSIVLADSASKLAKSKKNVVEYTEEEEEQGE